MVARRRTHVMGPLDAFAALAVILIWAFNFIAVKVSVSQIPPLLVVALRFALVAMLLAPFLRWPRRRWREMLALSVVLGGLHFGLLFAGMQGIAAGPAAIAIQLSVPFSVILAAIVYRERMHRWQIVGMIIAFAGVYILKGDGAAAPSLPHLVLVVAAALAWAAANILIKRLGTVSGFSINAWVALLALPQLLLASALLESGQWQALVDADWRAWGAILYMTLASSIIAYGLWYYLVGKHEVSRVVPLTLLAPVFAVLLAVALLDEPLSVRIVVGGLVTIGGVAMIQFLRPPLPRPAVPQ